MKKATNYAVKCENLDDTPSTIFKLDQASVAAPAAEDSIEGVELTVNIRFEPNTIGDNRAVLKLTSPENIEYMCILHGQATAP